MWWLLGCQQGVPADPAPSPPPEPPALEAPADHLGAAPEGFVDAREAVPGLRFDLRYSTDHNPTGQPLPGYGAPAAWLREEVAEALLQVVQNLETEELGLMLFDAYRPDRAERAQAAWLKRTGHQHLIDEGHVRAESTHPLGTAVDVTLIHLPSGEPFDMGTPWGAWGEASRYEAAKWPPMEHRALLRTHMSHSGFRGVKYAWWHFYIPSENLVRRDVPYGCFEEPEGEWTAPAGWESPTYRPEPKPEPQPCVPEAP